MDAQVMSVSLTGTEPGGDTSTSEVQHDQRDVEEYWTDRRMEEAKPAPMPHEE